MGIERESWIWLTPSKLVFSLSLSKLCKPLGLSRAARPEGGDEHGQRLMASKTLIIKKNEKKIHDIYLGLVMSYIYGIHLIKYVKTFHNSDFSY